MYIFAEPITEEQIEELQSHSDAEVEEFERNILGLGKADAEGEDSHGEDDKWADMQANVEEEMDNDEASLTAPDGEEILPKDTGVAQGIEHESVEDQDDDSVWAKDALQASDGNSDITSTVIDQYVGDEDQDDDESEDVTKEDNGTPTPVDLGGDSEGIGEDHFRGDGSPQEPEGDPIEFVNPMEADEGSQDNPGIEIEEQMAETEAGDEAGQDAGKAERADAIDMANDTEATLSEAPAVTVTESESESEELKTESQSESPPPEDLEANEKGFDTDADAPFLNTVAEEASPPPNPAQEVLAMTLTIRNKVNDRYVIRPENLSSSDRWQVEYALSEVEKPTKAWSLYQASQARRRKQLDKADDDDDKTVETYIKNLRMLSRKGKEWREQQDEIDKGRPKVVLGQSSPEDPEGGKEGGKEEVPSQ